MNGIHDLGGMHGLGPVAPNPDEPTFSHDWERRVFGMFIGVFAAGVFNVDEFRHKIELMGPARYLESGYYEHWLHALEMLVEDKIVSKDELEARINHMKGVQ
jgi:hypothetical protein